MKLIRKLSILAAMACVAVAAFAAQGDAKAILKELTDYRTAKYTEVRNSGKALDVNTVNAVTAEVKAKAEAATKDVDVSKVEAKDAYDWAQVFSIAGKHQQVCDLAHKALMAGPTAEQKYSIQMLMMQSCNALGEADMLIMTLADTKPYNGMVAPGFAMTASRYVDTIATKKGADAALKTLDTVEKAMIYEDPQVVADRNFERQKQARAANATLKPWTPEEEAAAKTASLANAKASIDGTKFTFVQKKAELLIGANRKDEAVKALDGYIAGIADEKSPARRNASMFKTRLTLPGSIAPALNVERTIGEFKSIADLKGKVVIIDTFAHWCGPCIASFPDVRKMYDELKPKGLEIVGVTTYYGYYKRENSEKRDMDKDTEFARMSDFMKEHNMNWPVVYGERTNFEMYGVSGIPTVFLIDKEGRVQEIKVGYSPESFKEFRAKVEKLLAK